MEKRRYHYIFRGVAFGDFPTKAAAVREATKLAVAHATQVHVRSPSGKLIKVVDGDESTGIPLPPPVEGDTKLQRSLRMSDSCWKLLHEARDLLNLDISDTLEKALIGILIPIRPMGEAQRREYGEDLIQRGLDLLRSKSLF